MDHRNLAIITARGGSKRIPRKNIKEFLGKPIIAYSIKAAQESKCFSQIMVSTDDEEIAQVAIKLGAQVPFFRSQKNSDDHATTTMVVDEVLSDYEDKLSMKFDNFCCIYPTAPFVTAERIRKGYQLLIKNDVDSIIPVVKFSYPIQRALVLRNGYMQMLHPNHLNSRSQDLESCFHDCGQFYWLKVEPYLKNRKFFTSKALPLVIPEIEVQDIDTLEDWKLAEMKYLLHSQLDES